MTVPIQPLNLADLYTKAEAFRGLQEDRQAMADYRRAQAQQIQNESTAKAHDIVQGVARSLWPQLAAIEKPEDRQAKLDELWPMVQDHLRGTPAAALLEQNGDHPRWESVQFLAGLGGNDEKFYGNETVDEAGNVWVHSDRGSMKKLDMGGGRAFQKPLTFDQGAGGTTIASPYASTRPIGNYPRVPNYEGGWRPPIQPAPPPVDYGNGPVRNGRRYPIVDAPPGDQGAGEGEGSMDIRFERPSSADEWAIDRLKKRGILPSDWQPPAPDTAQPPEQPSTQPPRGGIPPLPPPPVPRREVTPGSPVYPGGASDPGFLAHEAEKERQQKEIAAQYQKDVDANKARLEVETAASKANIENQQKQDASVMDRNRRAMNILNLVGEPGSDKAANLDNTIRASTGSKVGNVVDQAVGGLTGRATPGSLKIGELESIGAQLLMSVPRFEGPQSNYDVQTYREAAADIANPTTPPEKRIARLNQLRTIMHGYVTGERGRIIEDGPQGSASTIQTESVEQRQPAQAYSSAPMKRRFRRRDPATGIIEETNDHGQTWTRIK